MIPQAIVRRSVSRAISAETTVEERASMPCLRHHGYASASHTVWMPARSITRADASISSSGSIVSCMTPIRNGAASGPPQVLGGGILGPDLIKLQEPAAEHRIDGRGWTVVHPSRPGSPTLGLPATVAQEIG